MKTNDKLRYIADHYGREAQSGKLAEECVELAHAAMRYVAGKATRDEVLEEIADVSVMIGQMSYLLDDGTGDASRTIRRIVDEKIERTMRRIANELPRV